MEDIINYQLRPYLMGYRQDDPYFLSETEQTALNSALEHYNSMTENFPLVLGQEKSKKERDDQLDVNDKCLVYGEIDFMSFAEVFYTIKNRYGGIKDGKFYDLGSGMGKAVLAGALLHPFKECIGIELLESLYNISVNLKESYDSLNLQTPVHIVKGNFFDYDWSDAAFLFVNSTCFNYEMMQKIGKFPVDPGTLGVSVTRPLSRDHWKILETVKKNLPWGEATVFIQEKI